MASSREFPARAQVVIIGGGVIGCSLAYHLTKLGWRDVVLLERRELTCGTTWHAAGLLTTLRETENMTKLAKYTQDLYRHLEAETGQATGINPCGSIQIASTAARVEEMRRGCAMARCFGVESEEIGPGDIKRLWPLAEVGDIEAGFYFPHDARTSPIDTTRALAKGARAGGARIFEHTAVSAIHKAGGRVAGVETERGRIDAEIVVNCAGMWGREVGRMAGVNVPLQAAEHYYLVTEPIDGLHPKLPILRDPGNCAYYREETGKLLLGLFEPVAAAWGLDGIPADHAFTELAPDMDRVMPHLEVAMRRVPAVAAAGIQLFFCGAESFTPDHNYLLGEAPELRGFFVAAGFNSLGILSGGGAGMVMAHWIVHGHPPMDVWDVNIRRSLPHQGNRRYLADRVVESLGIGYQYHWPYRQWESARNVKLSPLHDRLAAAGACFGESAGWERANWYAPPGMRPEYAYSYGRQNWFEASAAEHRAVREGVGLFEQSSFAKLLVQGDDAEPVLNRIGTRDVAVPVGTVVYTQWLNSRGGIEADLTVTRLGDDVFLVVTAAFTHTHVLAWLRESIPARAHCFATDVSGSMCVLSVQGPRSRALLESLTDADLSGAGFPYGTCRELALGYQTVTALRVSYAGELGFELFIPTEYALPVYDAVVGAGRAFGLQPCGYHALNSLRIEKAFREWAHDIGSGDTPAEAGLGFVCDFDKPGGFVGREALLARRERGAPDRRLVQLKLEDPTPLLYHNEPIYRNGEMLGYTTSAMYGHTLGASIALGYVRHARGVTREFVEEGRYEIEVAGERVPAVASLRPLYDPSGGRMRS